MASRFERRKWNAIISRKEMKVYREGMPDWKALNTSASISILMMASLRARNANFWNGTIRYVYILTMACG